MRDQPVDDVTRVARKLAKAARRRWLRVWNGEDHGYRLGPPLPETEVAAFERQHGITLPADYRAFITRVGNGGPGEFGGAGPHHGLLPLDRWDEALDSDVTDGVLATAFPAEPGRTYQDWWAEVGLPDDGAEPHTGAIALSHEGCGELSLLVVTGPGRGRIASTYDVKRGPTFTPDANFLAWYERWLDGALRGALFFR